MKTSLRSLGLAGGCMAAALFTPAAATGQDSGFYFKADAGGALTETLDLKEFFGPVLPGSKVKLDPGFRIGFEAGYNITDWFAAELELGFMSTEVKSITGASIVHDASYSNVPFLVNARLQYPNRSPFTPYIGAGVGFSEALFSVDRLTIGNTSLSGDNADTVFAYQGFAGVNCRINDRLGLGLEYRYFAAEAANWDADFALGVPSTNMGVGRSQTHTLSLAVTYKF
jgi:OmpA-OmpF porin, OOP family